MSSNKDWQYDTVTKQWVRWSASQRCWVDREDRRMPPPRFAQAETNGPIAGPSRSGNTPSTSTTNAGRTGQRGANETADLERAMARVNVGPASSSNKAAGSSGGAVAGPSRAATNQRPPGQAFVTTERARGIETRWEVGATSQYTDPAGATQRSINVKRIREAPGKKETVGNFRNGRVIEVVLVPIPDSSAITDMTPLDSSSADTPVRLKRFVIIRDQMEDGNSFEAIPIKTYVGQGVAAAGVIKFHHTIIYTSNEPPSPKHDERPKRTSTGHTEAPMQAQAIRVQQWDLGKALDPMSRLDYGSKYVFDHGVPNIRIFGRVHADSIAPLYAQYNHVWTSINGPQRASNAVAQQPSGRASTADSAATERTIRPVQHARPSLASPDSGPITYDEMRSLLRNYHLFAQRKGLPMPEQQLNVQQIQALAANAQARAVYLRRIRESWEDEDDEDEIDS